MDTDAIADRIPLLQGLAPDMAAQLIHQGEMQRYPAQSVVIPPEEWGRDVLFILDGWVQITTRINDHPQTLDLFGPGSYLGTMAIFDDYPPLHQAIALTSTQAFTLSAQRFLQLILKTPSLQQRLLQLTNQRVRHLYRRLKSAHQSPPRRIMKTLVYLGETYGTPTDHGTEIVALSPEILGELVHCDPAIVEEVFATLQSHQLLELLPEEGYYCLPYIKKLHHFSKQF